jgi:hypothetical protein
MLIRQDRPDVLHFLGRDSMAQNSGTAALGNQGGIAAVIFVVVGEQQPFYRIGADKPSHFRSQAGLAAVDERIADPIAMNRHQGAADDAIA